MSTNILKIENVTYTYEDGTNALSDVSIDIEKGQKVAFLGANGSGKSTLFLCLNGILKPKSGTIYFNNKPIDYKRKGLLNLRSKVGIVFQDPDNQLFSASVYEEISFGVMNLGIKAADAKIRVEEAIKVLDISAFRHKPTQFLSGGQKKQVTIADILVMDPDVVILDEPASALDPKHTEIVYHQIDKLQSNGITVIISTHDMNHALEWSDKIIIMNDGKVLAQGKPEEIFLDSSMLKQSNLSQPNVIKMYCSLCEKGILNKNLAVPKSMKELEQYIEDMLRRCENV